MRTACSANLAGTTRLMLCRMFAEWRVSTVAALPLGSKHQSKTRTLDFRRLLIYVVWAKYSSFKYLDPHLSTESDKGPGRRTRKRQRRRFGLGLETPRGAWTPKACRIMAQRGLL